MWIRRAEFRLWTPMGQVWINADPRTARRQSRTSSRTMASTCEGHRGARDEVARQGTVRRRAVPGRHDYFSMADIVLLCGIDFAKFINMPIPDDCTHLGLARARFGAAERARRKALRAPRR